MSETQRLGGTRRRDEGCDWNPWSAPRGLKQAEERRCKARSHRGAALRSFVPQIVPGIWAGRKDGASVLGKVLLSWAAVGSWLKGEQAVQGEGSTEPPRGQVFMEEMKLGHWMEDPSVFCLLLETLWEASRGQQVPGSPVSAIIRPLASCVNSDEIACVFGCFKKKKNQCSQIIFVFYYFLYLRGLLPAGSL